MKCIECGSNMFLDDKDFNFKGNCDNYWCCEQCQTSCIEEIRYGHPLKERWHTENNDRVYDAIIVKWPLTRN